MDFQVNIHVNACLYTNCFILSFSLLIPPFQFLLDLSLDWMFGLTDLLLQDCLDIDSHRPVGGPSSLVWQCHECLFQLEKIINDLLTYGFPYFFCIFPSLLLYVRLMELNRQRPVLTGLDRNIEMVSSQQ